LAIVNYLSAATLSSIGSTASSISGSVAIDAAADLAIVKVFWGHFAANPTITTKTLGGNNITEVKAAITGTIDGQAATVHCFYLVAPPTGSQTVTINFSGDCFARYVVVESYSNANQTTPTTGAADGSGTGSSTKTIAPSGTTLNGEYISGAIMVNEGVASGLSTSDTQTGEQDFSAWGVAITAGAAVDASTGSGEQINWTTTNTGNYIGQAFRISAAADSLITILMGQAIL
jgi:hypothetical protein